MVHPAAPTPPNDGVSLTGPRRTAPTHLLVLAQATPQVQPKHPTWTHTWRTCAPFLPQSAEPSGFRTGSPRSADCLPLSGCAIALKQQRSDHEDGAAGWQPHYGSAKMMKLNINAAENVQKQNVTLAFVGY